MEPDPTKGPAKASGHPDMVLKYLTQINASVANLQTEVENIKKTVREEMESLRRDRNEDVRAITSRVATIGTHVSYLRQGVCQAVNRNRRDVLDGLKDVKDFIEKSSTAEIAFIRDVMGNANPDLFRSTEGFKMRPASEHPKKPEEARQSTDATSTSLPPPAVLQADNVALVEVPEEEVIRLIKFRTPFSEDLEVWDTFKMAKGSEYLKSYVDANLPAGTVRNTEDGKFVKALLQTLFNNGYVSSHTIPAPEEVTLMSSFPAVPKAMLIFLHEIAVEAHKKDEKFDIEAYWRYMRENFAPSHFSAPIGGKPMAASIFQAASGVVADENQYSLMMHGLPKSSMQDFVKERQTLRGSPGKAEEVVVSEAAEDDPNITKDETFIALRSHQVVATKKTDDSFNTEGVLTRRRTFQQLKTDDQVESSPAKKAKQ